MERWSVSQCLAWIIWRDMGRVSPLKENLLSPMEIMNAAIHEAGSYPDEEAAKRYRAAFEARDDLFNKLKTGEVTAQGVRPGGKIHEHISPLAWESTDSLHLFDAVKPNDIGRDGETLFARVLIESTAVLGLWPSHDPMAICRTGTPGRPSLIQLVEREWRRRRDTREALNNVGGEAAALHDWCIKNYPGSPAPTAKTIENKIRPEYRAWKTDTHK